MDDEMKYLHDNNTWELIEKPERAMLVSCKWTFKVKEGIKCVMSNDSRQGWFLGDSLRNKVSTLMMCYHVL